MDEAFYWCRRSDSNQHRVIAPCDFESVSNHQAITIIFKGIHQPLTKLISEKLGLTGPILVYDGYNLITPYHKPFQKSRPSEDMGVLENPGKYTMVIAENEEQSTWEPLHVEHGFNKQDSTVTLFFPNSLQIWPYGTDDKGILSAILYNLIPSRSGLFCLVLPPSRAKPLTEKGWTKKEIAIFLSEYGRAPAYRHSSYWGTSRGGVRKEITPINPMDSVAILRNPGWIRILVAGGPGAFMGLFVGAALGQTDWVTKKIELPANWNQLVNKYRTIVPIYDRY